MKKLKLWGFLVFAFGAILLLPEKVLAKANFDELLTDGKFVIHSVKPTSNEMAYTLIYEYTLMDKYPNYYINWEKPCNEDYTKCTIYYGNHQEGDPSKEVDMSYVYDKDIKKVVDTMVSKLPKDKTKFELTDLEYVNYLLYNYENESGYNLGDFSGQLKKAINYRNFNFVIDNRAGNDTLFSKAQMGIARIKYNDTTYYVEQMLGVSAKNIFYVDDNVKDVKKAVEERITKVFGKVNIKVSESKKTARELFQDEYKNFKNIIDSYASAEAYADAKEKEGGDRSTYINEYNQAESIIKYADTNEEEYVNEMMAENEFLNETNAGIYIFRINDTVNIPFVVVKDSSKVDDNLNYSTNDAKTNISISTSSSSLPLDALIKAEKLTSGTKYEKVIKTLDVKNHETFDLTLYSNSISKNIKTGKFEVKMPISDALKNKKLIVYYVGKDNKVEEHKVTVKDGYATFTTNHFSIYTLAEKASSTTVNPQTGDSILTYVGMLFVSALGVTSLSYIYLKNKKKIRNN